MTDQPLGKTSAEVFGAWMKASEFQAESNRAVRACLIKLSRSSRPYHYRITTGYRG